MHLSLLSNQRARRVLALQYAFEILNRLFLIELSPDAPGVLQFDLFGVRACCSHLRRWSVAFITVSHLLIPITLENP